MAGDDDDAAKTADETKPVDQPADDQPADDQPAEDKPAEDTPADVKPVEEEKPAEPEAKEEEKAAEEEKPAAEEEEGGAEEEKPTDEIEVVPPSGTPPGKYTLEELRARSTRKAWEPAKRSSTKGLKSCLYEAQDVTASAWIGDIESKMRTEAAEQLKTQRTEAYPETVLHKQKMIDAAAAAGGDFAWASTATNGEYGAPRDEAGNKIITAESMEAAKEMAPAHMSPLDSTRAAMPMGSTIRSVPRSMFDSNTGQRVELRDERRKEPLDIENEMAKECARERAVRFELRMRSGTHRMGQGSPGVDTAKPDGPSQAEKDAQAGSEEEEGKAQEGEKPAGDAEDKPAEDKPAEDKPADDKPADDKPADDN